jgi:DNA ligase (NAD+)
VVDALLQAGLIKDYGDIFYLEEKRSQLLSLPLFKEKKVENLLNSIKEKQNISLHIFLSAL